jgi:hypothetical protein
MKRIFWLWPVFLLFLHISASGQQDTVYRFSFAFAGGPEYFTINSGDEGKNLVLMGMDASKVDKYYNKLALGYHLGAVIKYHFGKILSLGLQYRFFNTHADVYGTFDPMDGVHLYYGKLSENIYVNYAGAGLYVHERFKKHAVRLQAGLTAGIAFYRDEAFELWSPFLLKGRAFGISPSVGIEIPLMNSVSVVAEGSWLISAVKKVKLVTGEGSETVSLEKDFYKDLSNVSLSVGLSITL